jgi:hypothetical protein
LAYGQLAWRMIFKFPNRRLNILNRAHDAKLNNDFRLGKGEMILDMDEPRIFWRGF